MTVLISVVVPVYNVEKYLDRCVRSLVNQTEKNIEIILVDDGATDQSGKICEDWKKQDNRIRVVHQANKGLGEARNKGLKIATGEFIAFIDSDDWIHLNMLRHMSKLLIENENIQFVDCLLEPVSSELTHVPEGNGTVKILDKYKLFEYFFRINGESSNSSICTKLIRREILKNFSFVQGLNEDVRASFDLYKITNQAMHLNKKYYYYYYNNGSITHKKLSINDLDYLRIWDDIVLLTSREMEKFLWAAKINRHRADFTLLSKAFFYGYEKDPALLKQIILMRKRLRKNFKELLFWKMPLSRKVLLILLYFNI